MNNHDRRLIGKIAARAFLLSFAAAIFLNALSGCRTSDPEDPEVWKPENPTYVEPKE